MYVRLLLKEDYIYSLNVTYWYTTGVSFKVV